MQTGNPPRQRKRIPWSLAFALGLVCILAVAFLLLPGHVVISALKLIVTHLQRLDARSPVLFAALYFAAYVAVTALCIPLEVPFAIGAGAIFGLAGGVFLASFASVCGASLAFLGARFLFRETVNRHFGPQVDMVNKGVKTDGVFYLINLRLLPVVPFSLCNVLMGLTDMPLRVFAPVSQACMIFATIVFVGAGTQLMSLHSLSDIMSPRLVFCLLALAALPWLAKGLILAANAFRRPAAANR